MSEKKQPEESTKSAKAGEVAAPEDTAQAQAKSKEEKAEKARRALARYMSWVMPLKGRFAFRGQANADWGLDSSAYRRLEGKMKNHPYAAHSLFVGYLHERINEARMRFSEHGGKQPLEVMAHLQHYGAATGLIDFTENALAALWFACKDKPEKDGKVFAVRLDNPEQVREIKTREGLKGELDGFFGKDKPGDKLWAWRPGDGSARMVTQQSLFVFGRPVIGEEFFPVPPYEVPAGEKELLLQILEQSGISETFMFSDFAGFAAANAPENEYKFHHAITYYDEKIDDAERAGKSKEEKAGLYFYRGNLNHALGFYQEALASYDKAIELGLGYAVVHSNRGASLSALGRHEEALASCDKAIELDSGDAMAHYNRGNALGDLDRHAEALASYDRAIELDSGDAAAHNNRGSALHSLGRYAEALASCDKAIGLDSGYAAAHYNRGNVLGDLGRHEEALASYDKAIELDSGYAAAHNNRGNVLGDWGRYAEALASYDKAIELDSGYAAAHNNRGGALRSLGRYGEALASYDKAVELDSGCAAAHNNRGNALGNLGRYEEALVSYDKAVELDSGDAMAHYNRGSALHHLKRTEDACVAWKEAKRLAELSGNMEVVKAASDNLAKFCK